MIIDDPALHRSVLEDPHDLCRRAVCADWLEEHDRADLANFIRAQLLIFPHWKHVSVAVADQAAGKGACVCEYCARNRAANRAAMDFIGNLPWKAHGLRCIHTNSATVPAATLLCTDEAPFDLPEATINVYWVNGFPDYAVMSRHNWWTHGPKLTGLMPLRRIRLMSTAPGNVRRSSGGKRCWTWFGDDAGGIYPRQAALPKDVIPEGRRRMNFDTAEEANKWLSNRLINMARAKAGLPEIPNLS